MVAIKFYVFCSFRVDKFLSIKIADFGLAKDIYSTEYYRVEKHTTLPVKWMAIESLLDGYFDEKTDVVCHIPIKHKINHMYISVSIIQNQS